MTYMGIDTAARISAAQARILRENGVSFVGRYLVPQTMPKALTAKEAAAIREAGLALMLCWELEANAVRQGGDRGAADGQRARECAQALGVPAGTCIYFACDYNIPYGDLQSAERYLKAAQAALGGVYVAGMYGPLKIMQYLSERNLCRHLWQCVAWSAEFLAAAGVRQYQWQGGPEAQALAAKVGFAVDLNDTADMMAAGMWMPDAAKPWYADAMAWAERQGLLRDGRPNNPVTRAELATVLYRIYGPEDDKKDSGLLS